MQLTQQHSRLRVFNHYKTLILRGVSKPIVSNSCTLKDSKLVFILLPLPLKSRTFVRQNLQRLVKWQIRQKQRHPLSWEEQ